MERIYGPYEDRKRGGWRVVGIGADGRRVSKRFKDEADALAFIGKARHKAGSRTVAVAVEEYVDHLERRGAPESTRVTTRYRLIGLTKPVASMPLSELTSRRCEGLYETYARTRKPATHHGALKEAKAWAEWMRSKGWIKTSCWTDVENIGRKSRGKPQLRINESVKLYQWCLDHAPFDDGACAVLIGLVLGLRASEIVGLEVKDLDDRSQMLWVARSKTQAGVRPVRLTSELSDVLLARTETADGPKKPDEKLLPYSRWWVRAQTMAACKAAGVSVVTAHALRGSNATLALEAGDSPEKVAKHLGHADKGKLAKGTYAQAGSGHSAQVEKVMERLKGKESPSTVSHRPTRRTTLKDDE